MEMIAINKLVNPYEKNPREKKNKSNLIFNIKKIKNQKKWTREEDELLIFLVEKYNEKHWKEISSQFLKKNSLQCFSRYKRIRPGIVKGTWKKEEDFKIIDLVRKYGKAWSKISKILGTRNGKQIRDRFINILDPQIKKGKFTEDEDKKLTILYKQYGPKWATIANYYPNRTADMIKNRFHSSIKKKISIYGIENTFDYKDCEVTLSSKQDIIDNEENISHLPPASSINNLTFQTTLNNSLKDSTNNKVIQEIESFENQTFNYSYYKEMDSELNIQNLINSENENKSDDTIYGGTPFIWNFEDYFTL